MHHNIAKDSQAQMTTESGEIKRNASSVGSATSKRSHITCAAANFKRPCHFDTDRLMNELSHWQRPDKVTMCPHPTAEIVRISIQSNNPEIFVIVITELFRVRSPNVSLLWL